MKKKISAIFMCVALGTIAIAGASLAYFTDTDAQKNTFVTGNVAIDLYEDFGDNDKEGIEKLVPATGSAANGNLQNAVTKKVYVENTGSEEAYVRVHIAIPSILDDGAETFDAKNNVLHFNYNKSKEPSSIGEGKWDWSKSAIDGKYEGDWNYYTTTIDGISYNVYVVTYGAVLKNGEVTLDAIHEVYLDNKVTNEDITKIKETLGNNWYIYVAAEGTQAAGFENAYDALNTAFGDPTDSAYTTKIDWKTVSGKTWVSASSSTTNE